VNPPLHIRARLHPTGEPVEVICQGGTIREVLRTREGAPNATPPARLLEGGFVAPGLFDLQINGCHGKAFSSARLTPEDVRHVVDACAGHGITGLCPTLITNSREALVHGFATLDAACQADPVVAQAVPGFHLEGPYISPEDGPRGAHPREHVRPPDWEEFCRFQDAASGRIRLVTLAPEQDGALDFIEKLTAAGVVVALGHTAASGPRIRDAVRAGARLSTHLGNGAHAVLPRHDNYLWEQLAEDGLWASLIADGHHLPPAVLRCMVRIKTPARLVLTCDAGSLAGLPPGRYREWGQDLEVVATDLGNKIVVPGTPYLAGSAAFLDTCLPVARAWGGLALADVLDMASARPRQLLGLPVPAIAPGAPADLILFDDDPEEGFRLRATIRAGEEM
jgi:N-acetylglucosamine-6-phosphate deacetylase